MNGTERGICKPPKVISANSTSAETAAADNTMVNRRINGDMPGKDVVKAAHKKQRHAANKGNRTGNIAIDLI